MRCRSAGTSNSQQQPLCLVAKIVASKLHHGPQRICPAPVDQHLGHAQPVQLSLPIHDFFSPSVASVYGQQGWLESTPGTPTEKQASVWGGGTGVKIEGEPQDVVARSR
jgi:hypothetical protein